ncbi:tRNA pseudouridine(38-40) synthase TruA [Anaerobacillus sp. MEB173]|uniref:tRNA pseudouridine(38-40) synthase TruA n=1 Tax=Anaerobacillus sp. MEB173 TaxID=3383345 RepID=UPI003F8FAD6C
MKRLKCTIAYDGSGFSGYQVQPQKRTVQGEIEASLNKIHKGRHIPVVGSGRTDATVHAEGQVIHFDTPLDIPCENWQKALRALLPTDIVVKKVEEVSNEFHARFNVIKKEYRYRVLRTELQDVFRRSYTYHYPSPLNIDDMREAAEYIVGTHDFTSFCSAKTSVDDKTRTISEIEILEDNDELVFRFVGNGFLYNMVRILVGTLLEVGIHKKKSEEIKSILEAKNRDMAGKTAPGHGLFLWKVTYDN